MTAQGDFLREARKKAGMKQTDVAKALGVKQEEVSQYERGLLNPNGDLARLCELYGVDVGNAPQYRPARRKTAKKGPSTEQGVYMDMLRQALEIGDEDLALDLMVKIVESR